MGHWCVLMVLVFCLQGDSGGPFVCADGTDEDPVFYQRGVTSWGYGCAMEDFPGVYTRVGRYKDWISNKMAGQTIPRLQLSIIIRAGRLFCLSLCPI